MPASSNVGNILGTVLGIAPAFGTAIGGLRRNRGERGALRAQQAGQGSGATIARQAGDQGARDAMGIAAGGNPQNAGANLLTGLRSAERAREAGGQQGALVGAVESQRATQLLHNDELARRQGISQLGGQLGNIFPQMAAGVLASKDRAPLNSGAVREDIPGQDLTGFFDDNAIPDTTLNSPFLDSMDAQDQQVLDDALAQLDEAAQAAPAALEQKAAPAAAPTQTGKAPTSATDTIVDPLAGLKDQFFRAFQSPEFESLMAAGFPKDAALRAAFPDLAAARDEEILNMRQGTGSGQTLQGPQ